MFQAIINVPGYLSEQDEPHVFDTAREAWEYLWWAREEAEDAAAVADPMDEYSDTARQLRQAAGFGIAAAEITYPDGTGVVYGPTPGGRMHDLMVAYSVVIIPR